MSAVEALAEVLAKHGPLEDDCGFVEACDCGWVGGWKDQLGHAASAVVAAIRSMPAEQVAELIGGGRELRQVTNTPATWEDGFTNQERVVTAWTEMPASPAVLGLRKIEPEPKEQQ